MSSLSPVRSTLCMILVLASGPLALAGCRAKGAPAPTPTPPVRVDNAALGLSFDELPEPFHVKENSGDQLVLDDGAGGTVDFAVSKPDLNGVNLVAEAQRAGKELAAQPDGKFSGGNELVTPFGAGYTVRGSYREGAARIEERQVFLLHPDGSGRLVTVRYRYPAGDSKLAVAKLREALTLVGALGAASTPIPG